MLGQIYKNKKNKISHVCLIESDKEFFTILIQVLKKVRNMILTLVPPPNTKELDFYCH